MSSYNGGITIKKNNGKLHKVISGKTTKSFYLKGDLFLKSQKSLEFFTIKNVDQVSLREGLEKISGIFH